MLSLIVMILTKLGLPLIDLLFKNAAEKAQRKKQYIEFMRKYDLSILQNQSIRKQYEKARIELEKPTD